MIPGLSVAMLRRSFERQRYRFTVIPPCDLDDSFGIYVHVPLCQTVCRFCPFYKEVYSEQLKRRYLEATLKEISDSAIRGRANWVYFGGGTPNSLTIPELGAIFGALSRKAASPSWGIELLPTLVDDAYLTGLRSIGFTKISVGVESFDRGVLEGAERRCASDSDVKHIISRALELGLWVNTDMMVGLPSQTRASLLDDIQRLALLGPSQVTTYPYMVIRGKGETSEMPNQEQFDLIEEAGGILIAEGYQRKSIWVFARGDSVYDSSRDELVRDYVGFGPAAFSTWRQWKVVNPEMEPYIGSIGDGARKAFVAPRTRASSEWRRFASMLYDLKGGGEQGFPFYISSYLVLLRSLGYIREGRLTPKGVMLAHEVTKSVVEALPFPVQNPRAVENYGDYLEFKKKGGF